MNYKHFLLVFMFFSQVVLGQDTIFYNEWGEVTMSKDSCSYFSIEPSFGPDTSKVLEVEYYKSGQIKREYYSAYRYQYQRMSRGSLNGPYKEWYESGQLKVATAYVLGKI